MARVMGIDYGRKRSGVAVTDVLQLVANALDTVPTHTLLQYVVDYVSREPVERIVVGQPTQLNGQPSESMRYIKPFLAQLRKKLPHIAIDTYDEQAVVDKVMLFPAGMIKSEGVGHNTVWRILPSTYPTNNAVGNSGWAKS